MNKKKKICMDKSFIKNTPILHKQIGNVSLDFMVALKKGT